MSELYYSQGLYLLSAVFSYNATKELEKYIDVETYKKIAAELGSAFLNFKEDNNHIIHSRYNTWQSIGDYNNFYDVVFRIATFNNIDKEKFDFSVNNEEYIFWAWQGTYLNLGAGAEIGIYHRNSDMPHGGKDLDHYLVDKNLSLPMELYLYNNNGSDNIENIFSWQPSAKQWWITGFNPEYVGKVNAKEQVVIGKIDMSQFTNSSGVNQMYDSFKNEMIKNKKNKLKYLTFDDTTYCVWLTWYE